MTVAEWATLGAQFGVPLALLLYVLKAGVPFVKAWADGIVAEQKNIGAAIDGLTKAVREGNTDIARAIRETSAQGTADIKAHIDNVRELRRTRP